MALGLTGGACTLLGLGDLGVDLCELGGGVHRLGDQRIFAAERLGHRRGGAICSEPARLVAGRAQPQSQIQRAPLSLEGRHQQRLVELGDPGLEREDLHRRHGPCVDALLLLLALLLRERACPALLRWRRDLLFFALFPLLLMIPYSGLFYVGFWRADRYFYLAAAGVLVLAAAGLHQIGTRWPVAQRPIAVASAAFLGICAVSSASHQPVWQDSESLWHYEVQRTAPSMLAIQAYAKLRVQETEAARSREARLAAAEQALAWIARGFERKAELKLRPTNYWLPETNQEAQLHLLKGRVAHTIGAPAEQQVVHFRRAFELAPNRVSALLLSGALFQVSQQRPATDQPALLRESLDAFESYIALSGRDAQQLEESRVLLERNFSQRFPALEPRLAKIRSTYYR